MFSNNCRNSCKLISWLIFIINKQIDSWINAMRQWSKADNSTVCHCKKPVDISFWCICPVIEKEFHHNLVKVVFRSTQLLSWGSTATLTMLWQNSCLDAWKTDVNLFFTMAYCQMRGDFSKASRYDFDIHLRQSDSHLENFNEQFYLSGTSN